MTDPPSTGRRRSKRPDLAEIPAQPAATPRPSKARDNAAPSGSEALARAIEDCAGFDAGPGRIERVSLVKSELRPGGPVYTPVYEVGLDAGY